MRSSVMVVDDEKDIRDSLEGVLSDEGFDVVVARSAEEALDKLAVTVPDLVLLDIWMPGMDGVEALKRIKERQPELPVIMISGHGTIETAVKTTKLGAYDFIEKPLSLDMVVLTVEHAIERKRLVEENLALKQSSLKNYEIIGESDVMRALMEGIRKVASSNSWVLITGDNGTGKEFVARNIHLLSNRSSKAFVAVNCAAIPEELIESELFGYEKGAFTGAAARKKGRFDIADHGTLFLDEIGDMSLAAQAKVLRILEEQSFERVGGVEKISIDVRVIAATNKDLEAEMKRGNFRKDLYYRLNVIPFHVPSLSQRASDIPLFVEHFLKVFSCETGREVPVVTEEALGLLCGYQWPGNVRELRNLMERLVIMTSSGAIDVGDLPGYIGAADNANKFDASAGSLRDARRDFEKEFITARLKRLDGNITKTAEAIGIERSHLYRKIKSYGIDK